MNVLGLTVFVGVVLVSFFLLLWLIQACQTQSSSERDALLPLAEESQDKSEISESKKS